VSTADAPTGWGICHRCPMSWGTYGRYRKGLGYLPQMSHQRGHLPHLLAVESVLECINLRGAQYLWAVVYPMVPSVDLGSRTTFSSVPVQIGQRRAFHSERSSDAGWRATPIPHLCRWDSGGVKTGGKVVPTTSAAALSFGRMHSPTTVTCPETRTRHFSNRPRQHTSSLSLQTPA
jgi:hypothetical protein